MNRQKSSSRTAAAVRVLLGTCLIWPTHSALAQESGAFKWSITPYLWASETKVDLTLRDEALGGDRISFSDLVDQIDSAFMVNIEGGQGNWSVFSDLTYLETNDRQQRPIFRVDTDSETTVLDAGFAYWPDGVGTGLSLMAGVRYSGFDNDYRFYRNDTLVSVARDGDDYTDALLGLRYQLDFSGPWELITRADYSFGESEGTWMLRAQFARTVGRREANRIMLGYQYKQAEFVSGDLRTKYAYHGPTVGFNFRF